MHVSHIFELRDANGVTARTETQSQHPQLLTSDRLSDAVQVCDVRVGGVDLEEVLLNLMVAVVMKLQCGGRAEDEEWQEEEE